MKAWQNNASSNTTFIQRKLTTVKLIQKLFLKMRSKAFWVSIILLFQGSFSQRELQEHHLRLVQEWKSILVEGCATYQDSWCQATSWVNWKSSDVQSNKDHSHQWQTDNQASNSAISFACWCIVIITNTNKNVAMTSNKKPPKTVTPFAKAFSPRLAVDMPELDRGRIPQLTQGKLQLLVQRDVVDKFFWMTNVCLQT